MVLTAWVSYGRAREKAIPVILLRYRFDDHGSHLARHYRLPAVLLPLSAASLYVTKTADLMHHACTVGVAGRNR